MQLLVAIHEEVFLWSQQKQVLVGTAYVLIQFECLLPFQKGHN